VAIDDATFNLVSQSAHFFSGLAVILVGGLFGFQLETFALWIVFTAAKEFWWDPRYETTEIQGDAWLDTCVSLGGGAVGLALLAISHL
jgi:hypothetical protein